MPNRIETVSQFIPLLDEVFATASRTNDLEGPNELVREGKCGRAYRPENQHVRSCGL